MLAFAALPGSGWLVAALVHLGAYILAVIVLDPIAAFLERVPFVRRLFSLSWTMRFRRYLAPGFKQKE